MTYPGSRPRSAWVEVDLDQFARNWRLLRREMPSDVSLMFVAKDNAYGLGAVEASRVALSHHADSLAVFTLGEAQELRFAGIDAPILLLGNASRRRFRMSSTSTLSPVWDRWSWPRPSHGPGRSGAGRFPSTSR